ERERHARAFGRSEGARVTFTLDAPKTRPKAKRAKAHATSLAADADSIDVFTTRIDTIYGATFVLLAPEHPLVDRIAAESPDPAAFRARVARFRSQDRTARMMGEVEKEGFDTGRTALNPFTQQPVPV